MTALNATAVGKAIGKTLIVATAAFGVLKGGTEALGAIKGGRALSAAVEQSAQPATSAPAAATSADIAALREHFDARFDSQAERLGTVEKHLAGVEGYMEAQKQAVLAKALSGRRE